MRVPLKIRARRPIAPLAWMLLGLLLLFSGAAPSADAQPVPMAGATASAGTGQEAQPPDAKALQDAIAILDDPVRRAEITRILRTLLAAQTSTQEKKKSAESVVDDALGQLDERLGNAGEVLVALTGSLDQIPALGAWIRDQASDAWQQGFQGGEIWRLVGVLGAGIVAILGTRILVRRRFGKYLRIIPGQPVTSLTRRILRVALLALPQFAFILVVLLALGLVPGDLVVQQVIRTAVLGMSLYALALVTARILFAPNVPTYRVLPMDDQMAGRAYGRVHMLAALAIWGGVLLETARLLGIPWTLHSFLMHSVNGILALLAVMTVQQWREPVARGIVTLGGDGKGTLARFFSPARLAAAWHVMAITWILILYLVWALQLPGGFHLLARGTFVTIIAGVVARLVLMRIETLPGAAPGDHEQPDPALEIEPGRLDQLSPVARGSLALIIRLGAVLVIAEAWGLGFISWLLSSGQEFLRIGTKLAIIGIVALIAWKLTASVLAHSIEAQDEAGNLRYSGRTRTLLQIVRNLLLALIVLIVLMMILSEIGIEAGPLLAGAGVVGLAIGFGSQRLVQDVIGGSFILLGDTIRVGDVVNIGGKAGVVEALSIRTVTLRSYNGDLHTVPYSSIDVVTNLTRDFSYAVFEVSIDYGTDMDRTMEIMREVADKMRLTWPWYRKMLEPLDIAGVDRLAESAVVIKARIKTRPGDQWEITREYQRRLRQRFSELGVSVPYPARQVVIRDVGITPDAAKQAAAGGA